MKRLKKSLLFQSCFFHERVEARLFARGGVSLDDILFTCFVEALDSEFELLLCCFDVFRFDRFARLLDGALENTLGDFISLGLLGGDAHVFLCGILDRHMLSKTN